MNELIKIIEENVVMALEFLAVIVSLFLVAFVAEWIYKKVNHITQEESRIYRLIKICMIGIFSGLAFIFMLFEVPLPFAPNFYKIDISELPLLVLGLTFGPVAAVMGEFIKILLNLLFTGTNTKLIGELANFSVGCSFLLPASILHMFVKKKKTAVWGTVFGTLCMTVFGTAFNAVYLLPAFADLFGIPLDTLIGTGTAINPNITDITTFVIMAVAPLNLIKGFVDSLFTNLIYLPLRPAMLSLQSWSNQPKKTQRKAS